MGSALMAADEERVFKAIGRLEEQVSALSERFDALATDSMKEHRKVHDIVLALSESNRNVARDVAEMKPLTDDYREKRAEARGAARLARWLYGLAAAAGGGIVFVLGEIAKRVAGGPAVGHVIFLIIVLLALTTAALAQQHNHPPADAPLHERFYSTWFMPDQPTKSCCNKSDCYPTEVTFRNGAIFAKRREDGRWLKIPANKIERNRDNPDGRNHLCAPMPSAAYPDDTVFCFALGTGG